MDSIKERAVIGVEEATASLSRIMAELDAEPDRTYEVVDEDVHAVVILNRTAFERLARAAVDALEAEAAAETLATEPLTDFAQYHARRMAGRSATTR